MRKKIAILALVLILVMVVPFVLAACGKGKGETVSLTVWGPAEHKKLYEELFTEYKAANKDKTYDIKFEVVSEADVPGKLTVDVEAGADIFSFANDQFQLLQTAGALARLGGDNEKNAKEQNVSSAVESAMLGKALYAYPLTADNGYFMYYDSRVFPQPSDVDTFDQLIAKAKSTGKKIFIDMDNSWYMAGFFFGAGASFSVEYDAKGEISKIECDFDGANGLRGAGAYLKLIEELKTDKKDGVIISGDDNAMKAELAKGTVIAAISGTWTSDAFQAAYGEGYAATKLPKLTDTNGEKFQMGSFSGYKLMGVNPKSKQLGEAHKLAAFLSGEAAQLKRFKAVGAGPSNINVANSAEVKANVALAGLNAQMPYATPQQSVPANYWTAVESFGQSACKGDITTANLQESLTDMANDIRSKNPINKD